MEEPNNNEFTVEQWEERIKKIRVRREDMNKLVMNFLVSLGHGAAAEAFEKESGTAMGVDPTELAFANSIKREVLEGNIDEAMDKVDEWDIELLTRDVHLLLDLHLQRIIECIRDDEVPEAIALAQKIARWVDGYEGARKKLEMTMSLLLYEDKNNCPVRKLLHHSQLQMLANELSAAVLIRKFLDREAKILTVFRHLQWVQSFLNKYVDFPEMMILDL